MRRNSAPYWITTKFGGKCGRCGLGIKKGEDALYFPADKRLLCARDCCGKQQQRDMDAERFDESVYHGAA
jgi:hypothetical protein